MSDPLTDQNSALISPQRFVDSLFKVPAPPPPRSVPGKTNQVGGSSHPQKHTCSSSRTIRPNIPGQSSSNGIKALDLRVPAPRSVAGTRKTNQAGFPDPQNRICSPSGIIRPNISGQSSSNGLKSPRVSVPTFVAPPAHQSLPFVPAVITRPRKTAAEMTIINLAKTVALVPGISDPSNLFFRTMLESDRRSWVQEYERIFQLIDQLVFSLGHLRALENAMFQSLRGRILQQYTSSEYLHMPRWDRQIFDALLHTLDGHENTGGSNNALEHMEEIKTILRSMNNYMSGPISGGPASLVGKPLPVGPPGKTFPSVGPQGKTFPPVRPQGKTFLPVGSQLETPQGEVETRQPVEPQLGTPQAEVETPQPVESQLETPQLVESQDEASPSVQVPGTENNEAADDENDDNVVSSFSNGIQRDSKIPAKVNKRNARKSVSGREEIDTPPAKRTRPEKKRSCKANAQRPKPRIGFREGLRVNPKPVLRTNIGIFKYKEQEEEEEDSE